GPGKLAGSVGHLRGEVLVARSGKLNPFQRCERVFVSVVGLKRREQAYRVAGINDSGERSLRGSALHKGGGVSIASAIQRAGHHIESVARGGQQRLEP